MLLKLATLRPVQPTSHLSLPSLPLSLGRPIGLFPTELTHCTKYNISEQILAMHGYNNYTYLYILNI